jgi:hypothetical protein
MVAYAFALLLCSIGIALAQPPTIYGSSDQCVSCFMALAQRKLARALMASLSNAGKSFRWLHGPTGAWANVPETAIAGLESELRGLTWPKGQESRVLVFNVRVPLIGTNVDLCLLNCSAENLQSAGLGDPTCYLALGELKGGIDPAAIAEKMAGEIWLPLEEGKLTNAANLTSEDQVASVCSWLCDL